MKSLGERLKTMVIPIIRAPHNMVFNIKHDWVKPAIGFPLPYGDGFVFVSDELLGFLRNSALALTGSKDFLLASHMAIKSSHMNIIQKMPGVPGLDVVRGIHRAFGGPADAPEETFLLDAAFRGQEQVTPNPLHAVVCAGSGERLRRVEAQTMIVIARELIHAGFKKVTLLFANNQRNSTLEFDYIIDDKNYTSLLASARAVAGAGVVVTPDSGLFNLALALRRKTVWLESREPAAALISPIHLKNHVTQFRFPAPQCARTCRARGHKEEKGYPCNLACWEKSPAPCLSYSMEDAHSIAQLAWEATNRG